MGTEQNNPLSKFFRQPGIHLKLPSNGRWWPEGKLELPVTGEIPIYPMTTKDEIILRTPDALMNGQGVVDVIQSCCPSIKDAWSMPSVDVDAVLIGIRIASYGNNMDVNSTCPHCKESNDHAIPLGPVLDSIECPSYKETIQYQTLKIKLHPQPYYAVNSTNRISFEEQKIANVLAMQDVDPIVKAKELADSMNRLVNLGIASVVESTEYIELEDGDRIVKKEFIQEFYENAESNVIKSIQESLGNIAAGARIKPVKLQCNECSEAYDLELEFDYANFFGKGF